MIDCDSRYSMQPTPLKERKGSSPVQSDSAGWLHWLTVLLILCAGTLLRFRCLACKPFWFDECFSVEVARIDWRNFLHLMWWREANMSLYYILLRIWLLCGQNPSFIRSLSVILSTATVLAVYWVAKQLYDHRVALVAAALFACNAYSVRYAQEARSYALFLLLATLSSGFLIAWVQRRFVNLTSQLVTSSSEAVPRWGYLAASVLAVYAHFYALLLVVSHWIVVERILGPDEELARSRSMRHAWRIIGVAVAPLLIFIAKTGAGPIRWIQRPGLHDMVEFLEHMAGGSWALLLIYAAGSVAALVPLGKRLWKSGQPWEVWRGQFLLVWFTFPIGLTVLLSFARPVFLARYMILCLPALLVLAGAGLSQLNRWLLPPALVAVLVLGLQGTALVYSHDLDNERDASGTATNYILDHAQPGDAVLFHIAETRIPYEFFHSLRAGTNTASPEFTSPSGPEILFPRHGAGLDYRDFTGKPTADFVGTAVEGHPRIWVMLMHNGTTDKPDATTLMLMQVLPGSFSIMERWQFAKVEVLLYSRR